MTTTDPSKPLTFTRPGINLADYHRPQRTTDLRFVEDIDELLVVQDVSLRLKQQLEDPVFDGLELVLVGVDAHDQLVPLLLKVWTLQPHDLTGGGENTVGVVK